MAGSAVIESVVAGAGGIQLAVREHGRGNGPTAVLVHGYPDNQRVWDRVADRLAVDHHVVTYDVRGAGQSDAPTARADYRMGNLIRDLVAVADSVSPDEPVHLVGHDWGSIQSWHAVTDPDASKRIASFTTISGPSLDHIGWWMQARRRPGDGHWRQLLSQLARSWYVVALQTPLAPLLWRAVLAKLWPAIVERREHAVVDEHWPGPTLADDAARGVMLYRANMFPITLRPADAHTDVPVQLLVPAGDSFVTPALLDGIERIAPNLVRREVEGTHWLPRSKPDLLARLVREHVAAAL